MPKLDHLRIAVKDYKQSRDWYVQCVGLTIEFELSRRKVAALRDDSGLTLFLEQSKGEVHPRSCILYFQVQNVDRTYRTLSANGVRFAHPPRRKAWGYGPELVDPDGYRVRLWDKATMQEKG